MKKITLQSDTPLVATATHKGEANFIVDLIPGGINLFNEIGLFSGQAAVSDIRAGAYRVEIEADGVWTLKLTQPVPKATDSNLIGQFTGKGAKVLAVRTDSDIQPTVKARHRGESNFVVDLIGFGELSGDTNIFNEIGRFSGETVVDEVLPGGGYLLYVQADGNWTLDFTE